MVPRSAGTSLVDATRNARWRRAATPASGRRATTGGGADAREKALEALRAATERISGEHGKNARRAAIGAGAAEALERLGAFFEAEAAAETDPERGEYVLALADDARAAAGNLAPAVAPTRTDAHNEL